MNKKIFNISFYKMINEINILSIKLIINEYTYKKKVLGNFNINNRNFNSYMLISNTFIIKFITFFFKYNKFKFMVIKSFKSNIRYFNTIKVIIDKSIDNYNVNLDYNSSIIVNNNNWREIFLTKIYLLDLRNKYESILGNFQYCITINRDKYKEFFSLKMIYSKKNNLSLFCTGGIRCDKFLYYLTLKKRKNIYTLRNGIINYILNNVNRNNIWNGECFLFDIRIIYN